jgi:transcriptional regulator with XRE-family HTH domain
MKIDGFFSVFTNRQDPPNSFTCQVGVLVNKARQEAGMSQGELSEALGIPTRSLNAIENGEREISAYELAIMARILQRPMMYFLPPVFRQAVEPSLSMTEFELLMLFARLTEEDRCKILAQLRGLVEWTQMNSYKPARK